MKLKKIMQFTPGLNFIMPPPTIVAGGIMFFGCPCVRPSVCPSVTLFVLAISDEPVEGI